MVLKSASAGWRESSRVCWTTTGMLDTITLEKIGVFRDRLGLFKIVEADVTRAPGGNPDPIGTGRITLREVDRDLDIGVAISGVQNANGFMACKLARVPCARWGNVSFRDRPYAMPDCLKP
jgi:hypothetical protein